MKFACYLNIMYDIWKIFDFFTAKFNIWVLL